MNRIQVHRRRFSYKIGGTFLGVWELTPVSPLLRIRHYQKLSFAIPRPDEVDRKKIRAEILKRISA
jgi:hypothetical protein